jgi:hypothetical protein
LTSLALLVLAHLAAPPVDAQVAENSDRWKISAELSYTDQSGTRDLRLFTGGLKLSHLQKEAFQLDASLQSRYGKSERDVIARNHYGALAFDLQPQSTWSPFLFADAENDPIKRLQLRTAGGAGAKYTPVRGPSGESEASVSLALLASYQKLLPTVDDPEPGTQGLARWSLRVRGRREVQPGTSVSHVTFYQPVWDELADYLLRSESAIKVLLMERLALSVAYELSRTSLPPAGVAPGDRILKTGIIINF